MWTLKVATQPRVLLAQLRLHEVRVVLSWVFKILGCTAAILLCDNFSTRGMACFAVFMIDRFLVAPMHPDLSRCTPTCLKGQTAIVTGGNVGIGLQTALKLARRGAAVVIACRNADSGRDAAEAIKLLGGTARFMRLDLADPGSVCDFVRAFTSAYKTCDILVNNAGVMFPPFQMTDWGWEQQLAINHLGHYFLTMLLAPELSRAGAHGCIINLSSVGHLMAAGGIDYACHTDASKYEPVRAYADSKLANVMFSRWLGQGNLRGFEGVAFSAHPGIVDTALWKHMSNGGSIASSIHRSLRAILMKTPAESADTIVDAVLSRNCLHGSLRPKVNGSYIADSHVSVPASIATVPAKVDELMARSCERVNAWWILHKSALDDRTAQVIGPRMRVFSSSSSK